MTFDEAMNHTIDTGQYVRRVDWPATKAAFGYKGVLRFRELGEPDWLFTFTRADEAAEWVVTHDPHHPLTAKGNT